MLFTTHGTTNLPMCGVAYSTLGVQHFLEGVMKIDTQDFVGKMKGFAVQGIKGIVISKSTFWLQVLTTQPIYFWT